MSDKAFYEALAVWGDDLEGEWSIADRFYHIKTYDDHDDGDLYRRKATLMKPFEYPDLYSPLFNQFPTPHDVWHTIRCIETDFFLEVCLHSVAEVIELRDQKQEWSYVFMLRVDQTTRDLPEDEQELTIYRQRHRGDMTGFIRYVNMLKLTLGDRLGGISYQFPGYTLCTTREWGE